jgi:hypothetical protein
MLPPPLKTPSVSTRSPFRQQTVPTFPSGYNWDGHLIPIDSTHYLVINSTDYSIARTFPLFKIGSEQDSLCGWRSRSRLAEDVETSSPKEAKGWRYALFVQTGYEHVGTKDLMKLPVKSDAADRSFFVFVSSSNTLGLFASWHDILARSRSTIPQGGRRSTGEKEGSLGSLFSDPGSMTVQYMQVIRKIFGKTSINWKLPLQSSLEDVFPRPLDGCSQHSTFLCGNPRSGFVRCSLLLPPPLSHLSRFA